MSRPPETAPARSPGVAGETFARWVVALSGTAVVAACMAFSFGNVLALGEHLDAPAYIAWCVAPAVDLTVVGLIVGIRHLSNNGASDAELRTPRLMLAAAGLTMWALNIAYPLFVKPSLGAVAYDSVPPLLLLGWSEVGPWFLRRFRTLHTTRPPAQREERETATPAPTDTRPPGAAVEPPAEHLPAPARREISRKPPARPAPATPPDREERETAARAAREILERDGRPPGRRRLAREAGISEHAARTVLAELPLPDGPPSRNGANSAEGQGAS